MTSTKKQNEPKQKNSKVWPMHKKRSIQQKQFWENPEIELEDFTSAFVSIFKETMSKNIKDIRRMSH